jgi:hypothetical protein
MNWLQQIGDMITRYRGTSRGAAVEEFERLATTVPRSVLVDAVSETFSAELSGSFGPVIGNIYSCCDGVLKAQILNTLFSSVGTAILPHVAGFPELKFFQHGSPITPEQAEVVDPTHVEAFVSAAQDADPSVVEKISGLCCSNPALLCMLDEQYLGVIIGRMRRSESTIV